MIFAFSFTSVSIAPVDVEITPVMNSLADQMLTRWKSSAIGNPQYHEIDPPTVKIEHAQLEHPFLVYQLYGQNKIDFTSSEEIDPRVFASSLLIHFPIVVDGSFLGTVVLSPNVDRDGNKLLENRGEYVGWGYTSRDYARYYLRANHVRGETGLSESLVSCVVFGGPLEPWYLVKTETNAIVVFYSDGFGYIKAVSDWTKRRIRESSDFDSD